MRAVLKSIVVLLLALLPTTASADETGTVSGTATLTVTVLPSLLDAAILPGCAFVVTTASQSASCNATLVVADPTLEMTGWRVTLAATSITCNCPATLPRDLMCIQAVTGPSVINGQPIDHAQGPVIESPFLGLSLEVPRLVVQAHPGYGNGAY